jgi:nucleotide-binding universal stress UspA family protein
MNKIVCATRGGEASRAVQMAAIEQAKTTGSPLVFLFVVSPEAAKGVEKRLEKAVINEMVWLGKVVLKVAEDRAKSEGVKAETIIRKGFVRDEICNYLTEEQAQLLLLGAPRSDTNSVFGDDPAERLASSIHGTTGVDVAIVRPGREDSDSYYSYLVPI